jgi:C4-type Zn-finger protein
MTTKNDVTFIQCGEPCDHEWDGPEEEIRNHEGHIVGSQVTCSKCGMGAMDVSILESEDE